MVNRRFGRPARMRFVGTASSFIGCEQSRHSTMIKFQCGSCGKNLKARPQFSGRKVKCSQCGKSVTVPAQPADSIGESETKTPAPNPDTKLPPVSTTETAAKIVDKAESSKPSFGFEPAEPTPRHVKHIQNKKKKKKKQTWLLALIAISVLEAASVGLWMSGLLPFGPPQLRAIENQELGEGDVLRIKVRLSQPSFWQDRFQFALQKAPKDAKLAKSTGKFTWTPTEADGGKDHKVVVSVMAAGSTEVLAETAFHVLVTERNQPPSLLPIDEKNVAYGQTLSFQAAAVDPDDPANKLRFSLEGDIPAAATINGETGVFQWMPQQADSGKSYEIEVQVEDDGKNPLRDRATFKVHVAAPETAVEQLVRKLKSEGIDATLEHGFFKSPFNGARYILKIGDSVVKLFDYKSPEAATTDAGQVSPDAKNLFGNDQTWQTEVRFYKSDTLIAVFKGDDAETLTVLSRHFGNTFAVAKNKTEEPKPVVVEVPKADPDIGKLLALYGETSRRERRKKLFSTKEYETLRQLFSERFERDHKQEVQEAYGDDTEKLNDWFSKHVDLKEEFYTAIDPQHDDVVAALSLMRELIGQFPKQIERYGSLAIAISVVWDKQRPGVYDYSNHQSRTKSSMPDTLATAADNFQYFIGTEQPMGGRVLYLPWEFLTLLVDHKTPATERQWALANYMSKYVMFGKCYHDVPYDTMMLNTKSAQANLNGQVYTLPNIRQFGGVCAMQADFAARVGKSIGVPAAYVGGMSIYGEPHAWVMWVELKSATKTSIGFTLESHGRYRGDKYYVGNLRDPHTGQRITDRDLELRLQTVGLNAMAKRQAELVMMTFPLLNEKLKLNVNDQLNYFSQTISLCPGNEEAWIAISKIAASGEEFDKRDEKLLRVLLDRLFQTFVNVPDFTWKVFDDLISYEEDLKKRIKYYEQLGALYLTAGRPDLGFKARLRLTDYLVEDDRKLEAIEGLALTIKKFPAEGQYVPTMLDKLEKLAADVDGADEHLIRFYREFLPTIPQMRGSRPSSYCMKTFERGIALFESTGQPQLAQSFQVELAKIKAGKGKKN